MNTAKDHDRRIARVLESAAKLPAEDRAALFEAIADLLASYPTDSQDGLRHYTPGGPPKQGPAGPVNSTVDDAKRFQEEAKNARGETKSSGSSR